MGLYASECSKCGKGFMWFSGNKHQICGSCIDEYGGGVHSVEQQVKNPEPGYPSGYWHFVPYNEAETHEDAIKLLIKRGVPEDELKSNT